MLSFKLGEVTVNKIIFEESDDDLLPDDVEDITPSLDKQNIIPPGINNVIILGTKKINKGEKTTEIEILNKAVNIKPEMKTIDVIGCEIDSCQQKVAPEIQEPHESRQQENPRNENKESKERFRPNQLVSIPAENIKYFQNECADPAIFPEANMTKTQNVNDKFEFTSETSTAGHRDKIKNATIAKNRGTRINNKNVQNSEIENHGVSLEKSVLNENVTFQSTEGIGKERETFGPKEINPIYAKDESTYQNERTVTPCQDEITDPLLIPGTRVQEDDEPNTPKRIKSNFPRTKVTSKREVIKYSGKMEAMRYHSEESKVKISPNPVASAADKNVSPNDDSIKCSMNKSNSNLNLQDPYILAMLTAAAENLLAIFPSLDSFLTANKTDEAYKKVESEFYQLKYDLFHLSYASTISIIIPNKDNKIFLKEFYILAANLAKKKQTSHFTIFRFEVLCKELIRWTQNKQKKIENLHTNSIIEKTQQAPKSTDKNNTELLKRLLTPPKPLSQIPDKPSIEVSQTLQAPSKTLSHIPDKPSIELSKHLQPPLNPVNPIPDKPSIEAFVPRPTNNYSTSVSNYKFKAGPPGREIEITYAPHSQTQTRANIANNQNHQNSNSAAASINNVSGNNLVRQPNVAIERNNQNEPRRNSTTATSNMLYSNTTVHRIPNLVPNTGHQPYQTKHTTPTTSISLSSKNTNNLPPNTGANQINYMDIFIESLLKTNDNEAPKDKAKSARRRPSQSARKDAPYRAKNSSVTNQNNSYQMGANIINPQNTVYRPPPPPYPMPPSQTNQIYQNYWSRSYPFQNSYQTPQTNHEYLYRNVTPIQQYSKAINPPVLPQERSSVSRDSGFMSPLGECNNILEQLVRTVPKNLLNPTNSKYLEKQND